MSSKNTDPEQQLASVLSRCLDNRLLWTIRPLLSTVLAPDLPDVHRPLRGKLHPRLSQPSSQRFALDSDNNLWSWSTLNQRRAFGTLISDDVLPPHHKIPKLGTSPRRWIRTRREYATLINSISIPVNINPHILQALILKARVAFDRAETILSSYSPRSVIVSSQHSVGARALIYTARERSVPSIYIPHAPVSRHPHYADLPFDVVTLRGPREANFYSALGADPSRLQITGAPGVPGIQRRRHLNSGSIVVAPSPWGAATLTAFMACLRDASLEHLTICPHPRNSRRLLRRLAPQDAQIIHNERTINFLAHRGDVVIQHSSGIALEAMQMGIPVIDICLDKEPPLYPSIEEPMVRFAHSPEELIETVKESLAEPLVSRERRRRWANSWCSSTNGEAAAAVKLVVDQAEPSSTAVLDGWRC